MKQTLDLSPTTAALGLDPYFGGAPLGVTGDVPAYPTMTTWHMQLWKQPGDAFDDDAEPLINAVGSVTSGVLTVYFTAAQTAALTLSNAIGENNFWLSIAGVDANNLRRMVRGGTIEIIPGPYVTDAGTTITGITVTNDVASFVYNGETYTIPVEEIATPVGAVEGEIVVIDDMAVLTIEGTSYTFPVQET